MQLGLSASHCYENLFVLGLQKSIVGLKLIKCELWNGNCSYGFIIYNILNIEIWKLFKITLLVLMAHFGCVSLYMYWFLDKGLMLIQQAFCVKLNKEQFLNLVCISFSHELEIWEKGSLPPVKYFLCWCLIAMDISLIGLYINLPCTPLIYT